MGYLAMLTWPTIAVGWVINIFQRGAASMGRILEIMDAAPEIQDEPGARAPELIQGALEFRNLTFQYPNAVKPVLHNINLTVPAGSTLGNRRTYGKRKIDAGQPDTPPFRSSAGNAFPRRKGRAPMAACPNCAKTSAMSPRRRFCFPTPSKKTLPLDATHGRKTGRDGAAADVSQIADDIETFSNKMQTYIGERGITLSGGQKQRVAISRAVLPCPRILIFDDSLSNVDTYTEERILEELTKVMKGSDNDSGFAPDFDRPKCPADCRIQGRSDRGTRNARVPDGIAGRVRGSLSETALGRGTCSELKSAMPAEINEEQVLGKAYDARLMRRLLTYIRPYRRSAYLAIVCLIAGSAFSILQPYLTKVAIDRYIRNNDVAGLNKIALLYTLTLIAVFVLSFSQTWLINLMGQKIMRDLRMEIFRHLQKLDVAFFDKNPVGRLMTRVTTDVDALNELFTSGVISVFEDIFMLSGIIISLFLLNYKLALAIVAILPLLILVTLMFKIKVRDSYRRVRTAIARINAFLQENITGAAVVQIFGQEEKQYRQFTHINKDHLDANLQSIFYYAIFFPLLEMISAMAIALIIWYGGIRCLPAP